MSSFDSCLVFAVLVAFAAAKPTDSKPYQVDLSKVLNHTVCPIKVEYDIDLARIPQRIKLLKCGEEPQQWCKQFGVPEAECCHRQRDNAWMGCTEVMDTVEVYFPQQDVTQPYDVAVGCACVIEQVTKVAEFTPGELQK